MTHCPDCDIALEEKDTEERPVVEGEMLKPRKRMFRSKANRCPKCRKTFKKQLPVLKRNEYGTRFISNSAIMHYLHVIPLKRVEELWGNDVVVGNLIKIFQKKLFHWVKDRDIPAENNCAERELRPTVIARKVSHGSQSKAGAKTRSIMMSVLHTVKKRLKTGTAEDWLTEALQKYIHNPKIAPRLLLPNIPKN